MHAQFRALPRLPLAVALIPLLLSARPAQAQFLLGDGGAPHLAQRGDLRQRLHAYIGAEVMGHVTAAQTTRYQEGYLSHFGGGAGVFVGVRLSPLISLEGNWTTSLYDEAWGDRYAESVRLGVIYLMTFTADAKLHLPSLGPVEPYLQAGIGLAILGTNYPNDARYGSYDSIFAKGVALNGGFGLDIWITPLVSMGGRVLYRGLALGEPSFSVQGLRARDMVHGLSVDCGGTLHF